MKTGDILTFRHEIISETGRIIFHKGDKVLLEEVVKTNGFWGMVSGCWIEEKVEGIRIEGKRGIWSLDSFEETAKK